jgi:hypothetical protein
MGSISKERLWGATVAAAAEKAREARRVADKLAVEAWNVRMKGYGGPVQPSPTMGEALNAGYRYLEVKCAGCECHNTVDLMIIRRPKETPIWQLERRMRCVPCSEMRGYPYKRGNIVRLRPDRLTTKNDGEPWYPGDQRETRG